MQALWVHVVNLLHAGCEILGISLRFLTCQVWSTRTKPLIGLLTGVDTWKALAKGRPLWVRMRTESRTCHLDSGDLSKMSLCWSVDMWKVCPWILSRPEAPAFPPTTFMISRISKVLWSLKSSLCTLSLGCPLETKAPYKLRWSGRSSSHRGRRKKKENSVWVYNWL